MFLFFSFQFVHEGLRPECGLFREVLGYTVVLVLTNPWKRVNTLILKLMAQQPSCLLPLWGWGVLRQILLCKEAWLAWAGEWRGLVHWRLSRDTQKGLEAVLWNSLRQQKTVLFPKISQDSAPVPWSAWVGESCLAPLFAQGFYLLSMRVSTCVHISAYVWSPNTISSWDSTGWPRTWYVAKDSTT